MKPETRAFIESGGERGRLGLDYPARMVPLTGETFLLSIGWGVIARPPSTPYDPTTYYTVVSPTGECAGRLVASDLDKVARLEGWEP